MKRVNNIKNALKLNKKGMTIEMVVFSSMLVSMFLFIIAYATIRIGMIKKYSVNITDEKIKIEGYAESYLKYLNNIDDTFNIEDDELTIEYIGKNVDSLKYIKVYDEDDILVLEVNFLNNEGEYYISSWHYRG